MQKRRLSTELGAMRCVIFHKPYDVLSQFTAEVSGQRTLADFGLPKKIYAAGRLDRDSEGLLLLTDDGPLIKRLLSPEFGHQREYYIQVEGAPTEAELEPLRKGVTISGYRTKPAEAALLANQAPFSERIPPIRVRKAIPTTWISLTLTEGKNRQIRKMTAAVGFPTLRLIRVAVGDLQLGELLPGDWRELTSIEVGELVNLHGQNRKKARQSW